jgi:DNA invertase Pin-like site-specific DNA recombinase
MTRSGVQPDAGEGRGEEITPAQAPENRPRQTREDSSRENAGNRRMLTGGAAQREACEAYIRSQAGEGWRVVGDRYEDGGFSGASLDRPALQTLLAEVRARKIDVVVVYKVDRLTRSLADFAKLIEVFDAHGVSFVSVTQSFNTTTSMGRLTLNILLSFAQFEREVIGERVRLCRRRPERFKTSLRTGGHQKPNGKCDSGLRAEVVSCMSAGLRISLLPDPCTRLLLQAWDSVAVPRNHETGFR